MPLTPSPLTPVEPEWSTALFKTKSIVAYRFATTRFEDVLEVAARAFQPAGALTLAGGSAAQDFGGIDRFKKLGCKSQLWHSTSTRRVEGWIDDKHHRRVPASVLDHPTYQEFHNNVGAGLAILPQKNKWSVEIPNLLGSTIVVYYPATPGPARTVEYRCAVFMYTVENVATPTEVLAGFALRPGYKQVLPTVDPNKMLRPHRAIVHHNRWFWDGWNGKQKGRGAEWDPNLADPGDAPHGRIPCPANIYLDVGENEVSQIELRAGRVFYLVEYLPYTLAELAYHGDTDTWVGQIDEKLPMRFRNTAAAVAKKLVDQKLQELADTI